MMKVPEFLNMCKKAQLSCLHEIVIFPLQKGDMCGKMGSILLLSSLKLILVNIHENFFFSLGQIIFTIVPKEFLLLVH